jgi:hypothetical protein
VETTLHRQLKALYGIDDAEREVRLGSYRIDAVVDELLIEVQVASLSAIRRKIADLVQRHRVLVVKPVVIRSYIVRQSAFGSLLGSRYSPTVHDPRELFEDFVHFAKVFPHPNLSLEILLIEQEEHRIPRRAWRRGRNYRVTDRKLRSVIERHRIDTQADLCRYLPEQLPESFTTADLARCAPMPRWLAQKMAYVLRCTGAVKVAGKQRNAVVYQRLRTRKRAA